jgi:hypothetical protein
MTILSGNRTTNEFSGATRNREIAQRKLEDKLATNQAIAAAHRAPGGGPRAEVTVDQPPAPQGSVKGGG